MVLQALVLALSLFGARAHANTIEGYTPSGTFATVGLDAQKNFKVAISSLTALHVIIDSGTVSISGGNIVAHQQAGESYVVTASSVQTTVSAQVTINTLSGQFLPADAARKQGVLCNNEDIFGNTTIMYIGPPGVSTADGLPLQAGSCYSPDVPESFTGELDAVSTATAHGSYVYHK